MSLAGPRFIVSRQRNSKKQTTYYWCVVDLHTKQEHTTHNRDYWTTFCLAHTLNLEYDPLYSLQFY